MITDPLFLALLFLAPLVYWLLPVRFRMPFLVLLSGGYLGSKAPLATLAVGGWTVAFVVLAPMAKTATKPLRFTGSLILAILGFLALFKYVPVLVDAVASTELEAAIIMPLGVSYYAFKLVHYAVEVNRNKFIGHSTWDALAWTMLFPAFTAGPIERFDHFLENRAATPSAQMMAEGWTRIIQGLVKKLVFADAFVLVAAEAFGSVENIDKFSTPKAWGFAFLMYIWAYLDFSAYSDIAIGASRLFGIRLMENFNWPIFANSISNFWKRWHMTLAGWCQVYVYMPFVGVSRNPYAAIYLTFLTMGIWHGAGINWILWGLFHGTGVAVHLTWSRYKRRRKWHKWMDKGLYKYVGILPTTIFVTMAAAFTSTAHQGGYAGIKLFAKLFFINLP